MILAARPRLKAGLASALAIAAASVAQAQQAPRPAQPAPPTTTAPRAPATTAPATTAPATTAPRPAAPAAGTTPRPAGPATTTTTTAPRPAAPAAGAAPRAPAAGPGGAQAVFVESSGDWAVYTAQTGRSRICYAVAQPQQRLPAGLNRDPAYLFVSIRPTENVRNEIALVLGFPTNESVPGEAEIGTAKFGLLTKAENGWIRNAAEEGQVIAAMGRGQSMSVKVQSSRGNALTDRYSLTGFSKALDRARKECS